MTLIFLIILLFVYLDLRNITATVFSSAVDLRQHMHQGYIQQSATGYEKDVARPVVHSCSLTCITEDIVLRFRALVVEYNKSEEGSQRGGCSISLVGSMNQRTTYKNELDSFASWYFVMHDIGSVASGLWCFVEKQGTSDSQTHPSTVLSHHWI